MSKCKPLDKAALQGELQELAGERKVEVHIDPKGACAAAVRETDKAYDIYLNPQRIRTEKQLHKHLDWVRSVLA